MTPGLRLLNLFIGMCKGAEGLPRGLYDLGYKPESVEQRFGNSKKEPVVPELIIASTKVQHTILFEWKRGANTEDDQLRRYSDVTTNDLVAQAFLTLPKCATHDVSVVGPGEFRDRIVMGVDGKYDFPVLVTTDEGLEIIRNQFKIAATDSVFRPALKFDWNKVTTAFYPLDIESELWEFAQLAMPCVLEDMMRGEARVLASKVANRIIPMYEGIRRDLQRELERKIAAVIDRAARREFYKYLAKATRDKGRFSTYTWDIIENPLTGPLEKRQQGLNVMRRLQAKLIEYFQTSPRQEDLPAVLE